jgi:hypothetical protein
VSPRAAERIAREAATQPFAGGARALNIDWRTAYDPKQVQRLGEALGQSLVEKRQKELEACERGERPRGPANDPALLALEMDGGRWQSRQKNPQTGSRWREDKALTITSYLPGDGQEKEPQKLVTSYLGTTGDADAFGRLARVEAERRGIRQAAQTIEIGDGASWIDTQHQKHFFRCPRILDYYHAAEHLHESARAACGEGPAAEALAEQMKSDLYEGRSGQVIAKLGQLAGQLGPPEESDPPQHPRRVLARDVGYFQKHQDHMDYPAYRARGWPIGSGVVEAGIKQLGKRVKGTEQFWTGSGAEAILALRAMWLSEDLRWDHYWLCGQYRKAAA